MARKRRADDGQSIAERDCITAAVSLLACDCITDLRTVLSIARLEMFRDQAAATLAGAMADALASRDHPVTADVAAALDERRKAAGIDRDNDAALALLLHGLNSPLRFEPRHAIDNARAVRDEHDRLAAADAVDLAASRLRGGAAVADVLADVAAEVERLRAAADDTGDRPKGLVLTRASSIECTQINWLWPQRIVGDGLTIITGPVGVSKSLITLDVAARVTTGGKWPDSTGHAPLGSVILFGAEDDPGKVVVPRLLAASGDLDRVHLCQGAASANAEEPAAVVLERHIHQLRIALDDVKDCRLIVFDPLPEFIAADENKSNEVRAALMPLAKLAQERNIAVVAILHQNKKSDLTVVQRIAGSTAFAQVARIVLTIGTHPEDAEKAEGKRRVMIVSKSNYSEKDVGQIYEIEQRSNGQPALAWHPGTVAMDAEDITRRPTGGREHESRRSDAVDALRELLTAGELSASAVTERLQDSGFGRRQIDHAADALNIVKQKTRDGWRWRLPAREMGQAGKAMPDPAFEAWAPSA